MSGNKYALLLPLFVFFSFVAKSQKDTGYEIKIKVEQFKDTTCYLANYYGKKQYYKDTSSFDANGVCVFKGDKPLPGGIYSIVLPNKSYFEFMVNEPEIFLETDTSDFVGSMNVRKSLENKLFFDYMNFLKEQTAKAQPYRRQLSENPKGKKAKSLQKKLSAIDEEVQNYQQNIIDEHPNTLMTAFLKASREIEIPETPVLENGEKDSAFPYRYYKQHYWDNIDLSDSRLLRTPIFHRKLDQYFKKVVPQVPDSIIKAADAVIEQTKDDKDMFKYTVHYVTNTSERSKVMGMDAVFVHMVENYYATGQAYWLDSAQTKKIVKRAGELKPLLIGKKAHNLSLADSVYNWHRLYDVKAPVTILVFWDPECGHCKKVMPELVEVHNKVKNKGVKVYSVSSDHNKKWTKFIKNKGMQDFINVAVPKKVYEDETLATKYVMQGLTDSKSLNYTQTFDVFSTPQIYVLDDEKKIIAKKVDVEQLDNIIKKQLKK